MIANDDFESLLLGSIVLAPEMFHDVRDIVTALDFSDSDNAKFFSLLCDMSDIGQPINDMKLMFAEVNRRGIGFDYQHIAELFNAVPYALHATYYADNVVEKSRLRRLLLLSEDIVNQAKSVNADTTAIVESAVHKLNSIDMSSRIEIDDAKSAIEKFDLDLGDAKPVPLGLGGYDNNFGGATAGELVTVAARLGCGKTAFGWQWLRNALSLGLRGLFVSCEMTTRNLMDRHISSVTGINSLRVKQRSFNTDETERVELAKEIFAELPISIFVKPRCRLRELAGAMRLKKSGGGLDFAVVDYFQLMRANGRLENHRMELEEVSRGLKALALEMDVPIIILAQLNRQADDVTPRTSQIADTDALARDSDQVLLLHRKPEGTDLRVAKHRFVADDAVIGLTYENGKFNSTSDWTP